MIEFSMFKINFRQPTYNSFKHVTGHSPVVREGLSRFPTREAADAQLALFKAVHPATLFYIVPA